FALLTIEGLIAFRHLGIQNFPDLEVPTIIVSAALEGAAPAQLESDVARKIEDAVASLGGIEHIRTTVNDGALSVVVEFSIDKESEVALNEVRNAVDSVRSDLPQDLTNPVVAKKTTTGGAILSFSVTSASLDEADLSWFVDNELSKAMMAVPGVGRFTRIGGIDREFEVVLDPVRLSALGLSVAEVSQRLRQVLKDSSGGRGDMGGEVQSFRTLAAARTIGDVARLTIPLDATRSMPLGELATVRDGFAERTSLARVDDKPVLAFEITRTKGHSEVNVAQAVRRAATAFQQANPHVTLTEVSNNINRVLDNYHGSMELLFEGAFLAVVVVWWFLRDWRATLVSAVALPLSIIPTFLIMRLSNFSLDTLTLLSLALVVGILVDDAIVEVENIVRHQRLGKSPMQASLEAADEIGLAVIATSLTLVAVFLPTAFMGGVPGKVFRPFGFTAAAAVLASLVVARLLTPMMAAYLLKTPAVEKTQRQSPFWGLFLGAMAACLRHRLMTVIAALLFTAASLSLLSQIPKSFIPAEDRGQIAVVLELPPGTSLESNLRKSEEAVRLIRTLPEVTHVFAAIGVSTATEGGPLGMNTASDARKSTLTVNLTHRKTRALKQTEVEAHVRRLLKAIPGLRVGLISSAPGTRLVVTLASDDPAALDTALRRVEKDLRGLDVGNITSNASLERPEVLITPDFARAADLGVTAESIAQTVRLATAGDFKTLLPKVNLPQRQIPIRVRLDRATRQDLEAIRQLRLPARNGMVTLQTVASVEMASSPALIDRLDRLRRATLDVELGNRVLGDVAREVDQLDSIQNLPAGVKRLTEGEMQRMAELFSSFGAAMIVGILCIYIVLVLLFHDFLQPITILAALPLSLGGAFLALHVTNNAFSMPVIIGVLMLMGVVTKNSILLVEYAILARRERGLSRFEALLDAGRKRSRPIIMTTIAMAAGMLPVALGLGAEPSFRSPMAVVVIGGLLTSTFLSLLVIPVCFTYVDDLLQWGRRMLGWEAKSRSPEES
ncbi:MAG: efflux RND transporter permease subunit, partial [Magnetococcales bacterium]|nr:efflux RND transporter permease subunit [Magnetococcales bacterium]